jgi:hypothetical protein
VSFSVQLRRGNKKPKVLVAPSRLSDPQTNQINNLTKGQVVLVFDNSYSYMTGKEITLTALIRPPMTRAQKRREKQQKKKNNNKK